LFFDFDGKVPQWVAKRVRGSSGTYVDPWRREREREGGREKFIDNQITDSSEYMTGRSPASGDAPAGQIAHPQAQIFELTGPMHAL
jgi:hypothetical protein